MRSLIQKEINFLWASHIPHLYLYILYLNNAQIDVVSNNEGDKVPACDLIRSENATPMVSGMGPRTPAG